jgi:hypothetical protein
MDDSIGSSLEVMEHAPWLVSHLSLRQNSQVVVQLPSREYASICVIGLHSPVQASCECASGQVAGSDFSVSADSRRDRFAPSVTALSSL